MAYKSRHEQRDAALPVVRDQLLQAAREDLKCDPRVVGIYLAGSLAKGNDDRYSDVDLHIIVSPGTKGEFIRNKRDRPTRWGQVLYYEDVAPSRPVVVVHFEPFVKMDTWYHEPEELRPSIWLSGCKALYDPEGMIQRAIDQSGHMTCLPTANDIELWRGKVFAYIHELYRSVMRDELYYAMTMLDSFRWQIARGWYMEKGIAIDSGWGVWSKIDGPRSKLDGWQSALLRSWHCELDGTEIMRTMASMVPEFLRLHSELCKATGLAQRHEWCESMINKVL